MNWSQPSPRAAHPRPVAVAAFCLWVAAAFGLVIVCLRAAGTPWAAPLGIAVFVFGLWACLDGERP